MTNKELYELIKLPEGVIEQLSQYENNRKGDIPAEIKEKLFKKNVHILSVDCSHFALDFGGICATIMLALEIREC